MTTTHAPDIEDLFLQGNPLEHVIGAGLDGRWSREDVLAVLREHQWDLDASGRLPRSKRVTTPRTLRAWGSAPTPPPAKPPTSTTSRHRTFVPDPLDGHPLPVDEPTPAEALAEQDELDVAIGDLDEQADLEQAAPAQAKRKGGRKPKPIEHGTDDGYWQHKRKKEPIPADDSCGCQAAHDATLTRKRRPAPEKASEEQPQAAAAGVSLPTAKLGSIEPPRPPAPTPAALPRKPVAPPLPPIEHGTVAGRQAHHDRGALPVCDPCQAAVARPVGPTAEEVRAQVDAIAPRATPDGLSVNGQFVAIEQTLRAKHGLPGYIPELDGPGKFLPPPPLAPWEEALVAAVFDPNDPRLGVPDGSGEPLSGPVPPPDPVPAPEQPSAALWLLPPSSPAGRDLDEWLHEASGSESPAVRELAAEAAQLHQDLHDVLDELVQAEQAHARGDR